jgi:hypothetical protein
MTECVTDFIFESNEVYSGQIFKIKVVCDNSKCNKAVRGFKFKLVRSYSARDSQGKGETSAEGYILQQKMPGIPAKTKAEKTFEIQIPELNKFEKFIPQWHPDERAMMDSFTPTTRADLFSVVYTLKAFVKHDSWNELGEGNCIEMPIRILQAHKHIVSAINVKPPIDWNPYVQQIYNVEITEEQRQSIDYFTKIMKPAEDEWAKVTAQAIAGGPKEAKQEKKESHEETKEPVKPEQHAETEKTESHAQND